MGRLTPVELDLLAHLPDGRTEATIKRIEALPAHERGNLAKAAAALATGRRLRPGDYDAILPLFEKLGIGGNLSWDEALNHAKVLEYFRKHVARKKLGPGDVEPRVWAARTTRGAKILLRLLMGEGYNALRRDHPRVAQAPKKFADFPPPSRELAASMPEKIELLRTHADFLERRIGKYLASEQWSDATAPAGIFSVAKGVIGEVLARPMQNRIVADFQSLHPGENVQLFTELTKISSGRQEFSDGIIGYLDRFGHLQNRAMTEVKSYADEMSGLRKARGQFFDWLESGGIKIGTKFSVRDANGKEHFFVYDPYARKEALRQTHGSAKYIFYSAHQDPKTVQRYVVGYSGRSHVGFDLDDFNPLDPGNRLTFDNGDRTVGTLTVIVVPGVDNALLDWVTMHYLRTRGRF